MTEYEKVNSRRIIRNVKVLYNVIIIIQLALAANAVFNDGWGVWFYLFFAGYFIFRLAGVINLERIANQNNMNVHEYLEWRKNQKSDNT